MVPMGLDELSVALHAFCSCKALPARIAAALEPHSTTLPKLVEEVLFINSSGRFNGQQRASPLLTRRCALPQYCPQGFLTGTFAHGIVYLHGFPDASFRIDLAHSRHASP